MPALRAMASEGVVSATSREIAAYAGVSHWTVQEAILDLAARGKVTIREGVGEGKSHRRAAYVLHD